MYLFFQQAARQQCQYSNMMQMWSNMFPFMNMFPFFNMFQMLGMNPNNANPNNAQVPQNNQNTVPGMPFQIPGLDLSKLLQMDMSPEKLNMLQKALDFAFDAYTKEKKADTAQSA